MGWTGCISFSLSYDTMRPSWQLTSSIDTNLQLETPRLLLRLPRAEDLDPWAELMADAEAARFIGGTAPRAMVWRSIMTMIGAWHSQALRCSR